MIEDEIREIKWRLDQIERGRAGLNSFPGTTRIGQDLQVEGNYLKSLAGVAYTGGIFVPLLAPLTSTSFDGDSFSTTAKTLIDLSAVFGVPAGVKAILVFVAMRDSGSAAADTVLNLSPNNTAGSGIKFSASGLANDAWHNNSGVVPCDANGDIYYQISASGASTMDVHLQIWGYWL